MPLITIRTGVQDRHGTHLCHPYQAASHATAAQYMQQRVPGDPGTRCRYLSRAAQLSAASAFTPVPVETPSPIGQDTPVPWSGQ